MRDALILVFANKQDHKDGMKSLIFTHAIMSGIGVHRKELCDVFVSEQYVITRSFEFWGEDEMQFPILYDTKNYFFD